MNILKGAILYIY